MEDFNENCLGNKMGRPRKLSPENQFFLFLCRVRVGLFELDLSYRFKISIGTVSNIVISWANFMYLRLGSLCIWPSKEQVIQSMPNSFKQKYPDTRVPTRNYNNGVCPTMYIVQCCIIWLIFSSQSTTIIEISIHWSW